MNGTALIIDNIISNQNEHYEYPKQDLMELDTLTINQMRVKNNGRFQQYQNYQQNQQYQESENIAKKKDSVSPAEKKVML